MLPFSGPQPNPALDSLSSPIPHSKSGCLSKYYIVGVLTTKTSTFSMLMMKSVSKSKINLFQVLRISVFFENFDNILN